MIESDRFMNVLYLMNVDWNWIKQRPHFIAERLAKRNKVIVLYQHRYSRNGYQNRRKKNYVKPVYVIPKGDHNKILAKVNTWIWKKVIQKYCKKNRIECIYITYPTQVDYIGGYKGNVIYDCMDNHAAFIKDTIKRSNLIGAEQKLINRSDVVICSSFKLEEVLKERYGNTINNKLHLVRNGYDGEILENINNELENDQKCVFAYFGTISSWFNFDFLLRSLNDLPNIEYRLIGPIAGVKIPVNPRIKYYGTVEHKDLYNTIRDARCLIMPFKINDIIESVDPVKLYEYINFNKDIIASEYPEITRFAPFVYFYNNYEEYISQIRRVISKKEIKYNNEDRIEFLNSNSWNNRADQIEGLLQSLKMR